MEILKIGSRGTSVKLLQQKLNLVEDGIFGPITEERVMDFQQKHGLVPDGIVGPATWAKLTPATRTIKGIILHCSATPEGKDYTVSTIRQWHLQRGFNDIGYHFVIYRDGSINKGRDISKVGAHCTGHNSDTIGICYVGGCDITGKKAKDTRTPQQKASLVKLVRQLMTEYNLTKQQIHCHYEYANKACPSFDINSFRNEL